MSSKIGFYFFQYRFKISSISDLLPTSLLTFKENIARLLMKDNNDTDKKSQWAVSKQPHNEIR